MTKFMTPLMVGLIAITMLTACKSKTGADYKLCAIGKTGLMVPIDKNWSCEQYNKDLGSTDLPPTLPRTPRRDERNCSINIIGGNGELVGHSNACPD